ncbi:MAG: hypothetical protein Q4G44_01085 [Alcaligenaceae bacterium]|nr:hypothetical protein [Alcaligenaceae bacterium]
MKAAFLILSAINQNSTQADQALAQLQHSLITLTRDYELSPNAVIEYSDEPLSEVQKQAVLEHSDLLAEFRPNDLLINLKNKPLTEGNTINPASYQELLKIIALNWFLQNAHGANLFNDLDYVVVIEAGAELDKSLIHLLNQSETLKNKFFFKKAVTSQVQSEKGRTSMYYPTEQWAYSAELTDELINNIIEASENTYKQLEDTSDNKPHTDLGHELFKAVDLAKVHFLI